MMGHYICFYGEIWLITPNYPFYPFLSGTLRYHSFKNGSQLRQSTAVWTQSVDINNNCIYHYCMLSTKCSKFFINSYFAQYQRSRQQVLINSYFAQYQRSRQQVLINSYFAQYQRSRQRRCKTLEFFPFQNYP